MADNDKLGAFRIQSLRGDGAAYNGYRCALVYYRSICFSTGRIEEKRLLEVKAIKEG